MSSRQTVGAFFDVFQVPSPRVNQFTVGCQAGLFVAGRGHEMVREFCGNLSNFFLTLTPPVPGAFFYLIMNYTSDSLGVSGR